LNGAPAMEFCAASRRAVVLGIALLLVCTAAESAVSVVSPWVQPTPDRAATEAYMQLGSSEDAVLKGARSMLATTVVIRAAGAYTKTLPQLALTAGVPVVLAPGAIRLVLRGLAHPLAVGDRVPLVLTIETANGVRQEITVNAEVRLQAPPDDARHAQPRRN
jgi:periplasmic copper chaperone A